jgi:hypothetical protein
MQSIWNSGVRALLWSPKFGPVRVLDPTRTFRVGSLGALCERLQGQFRVEVPLARLQ